MAGIDLTQENPPVGDGVPPLPWRQLSGTEARERSLLAAAIHDDPMQLIVASMLQIDHLRMNPSLDDEEAWEKIIVMLENSVERLRRLITAITPPDAADGLVQSLDDLAVGIFMGSPTTIAVHNQSAIDLSAGQEQLAHFIFREALVNAREHARASSVVLTIEQSDRFVATLTDDGVGGAAEVAGGGLAAIRAATAQTGGELRIDSPPGGGTTVRLTLSPP